MQHVAAGGVQPTQAALLAAAGWGAPQAHDPLGLLGGGSLAAGFRGMMLPDHAAVQAAVQAAALQHQLASLMQVCGWRWRCGGWCASADAWQWRRTAPGCASALPGLVLPLLPPDSRLPPPPTHPLTPCRRPTAAAC